MPNICTLSGSGESVILDPRVYRTAVGLDSTLELVEACRNFRERCGERAGRFVDGTDGLVDHLADMAFNVILVPYTSARYQTEHAAGPCERALYVFTTCIHLDPPATKGVRVPNDPQIWFQSLRSRLPWSAR